MPNPKSKSASFDVLGTCFTFTPTIDAIQTRLSPLLAPHSIDPTTLFFSWFYAAQRDFTYTSMIGPQHYTPIASILQQTLRRACAIVGVPDVQANISDEDVQYIMSSVKALPARPGLKELYDGLREAGWDVYAVTNGGKETSLKYYELAGVELDAEHLLSCDDLKVAKPDLRVYENVNRHLTARGLPERNDNGEGQRWFIAAHAWDLIAAREAGFRTAWVEHEEYDPCTGIFGKFDIYAKDFGELLEKMKAID